MSLEAMTNLLAEGNGWGQLIGPLLLVGFYIAASIFKAVSNRTVSDDDEDDVELSSSQASADTKRYRPLEPAARPQTQSPQSRTLPYARTVEQGRQHPVFEARQEPADQQQEEWTRQEQLKQRRREQIEQMRRRQQLKLQQAQRLQQQTRQLLQKQPPRQAASSAATRPKTPQEAVRQARVGMPMRIGSSRRDILKQSAAATAASLSMKDQAPPEASRSLHQMLRQKNSLRTAVVLKEILDTPAGLRDIG